MDEQEFDAYFNEERTWTTILSDGRLVPLIPDGTDKVVHYLDRHEYADLVKAVRMSESDQQVRVGYCLHPKIRKNHWDVAQLLPESERCAMFPNSH